MTDDKTYFDLPIAPEQFGVLLPPAELRRIDFSALDYSTARRAMLEYIRTYWPDDFNDFVASNGIMMLVENQASNVAKLSMRADMLASEAFLPTAQNPESVINHLALINQSIKRQTPAVVDVEVSVPTPIVTDLSISPGLVFQVRGPDNEPLFYELYRAPGDFTSDITIPAGQRGVIGFGLEGRFASDRVVTSPGGLNQKIVITEELILSDPFLVYVGSVAEENRWVVTTEPLEKYGSNDRVCYLKVTDDRAEISFGNNVNGVAPLSGQQITVRYRIGGGIRGRIQSRGINETRPISPQPPASSPVSVTFRNLNPSSGGTDKETLEQAKRRAPRDFVVKAFASDRPASVVTDSDYAQLASTFAHPHYGAVSKAMATVRTSVNANKVELYILAEGPDGLVTPSAGLRRALGIYVDQYNVLTDSVEVLSGSLLPVDVEMTVVVNRNADAVVVKDAVSATLDTFFDYRNRELGQPLYKSELVQLIRAIDGVSYVDVFLPTDNILATGQLAAEGSGGVGINEIIVEGSRDVKVYYERVS